MSSPNLCIWHLSCSIFIILFRMLANQYACKISGKKMEVIDCGRDITYSRTSDKKYGDQVILEDVSLDVKKGEVIVVVGPSGCGKVHYFDVSMPWSRFRAAWSNWETRSLTRKTNL